MSSYSESEGEIIEVGPDKATTALPSVNGTSVDRQSRVRLSASPSPVPVSEAGSSRKSRSPRGDKRRHDDDDYRSDRDRSDPRRFKVHYEKRYARPDDRPTHSHRASAQVGGVNAWLRDDDDLDDRDPYKAKRARTRSRSPYRASRGVYPGRADKRGRDGRYEARNGPRRENRGYEEGLNGHLKQPSVNDWADIPPTAQASKRQAETQPVALQQSITSNGVTIRTAELEAGAHQYQEQSEDVSMQPPKPAPADEASLIEERRKRREAIKAKYKGQATPLLVQALQLGNDSEAQTPMADTPVIRSERSVSPTLDSPRTPHHESGPGSPTAFAVTNDEDLANNNAILAEIDGDEPSAADYDPTADMREDQQRNEQRHHPDEVSSAAYDETNADEQKVLPEGDVERPQETAKPNKNEFDMFADGDDDDMFAAAPVAPKTKVVDEPSVAVTIPRALNMNLLDNWDDTDGYYRVLLGELLDGRYRVQANLGKGMFSGVVRALDATTQTTVAIKIIRNNETMRKAGLKEIVILQKLNAADPEDRKHIIRLERAFEHKAHLCMVFENLSINLREVLKKFGRDVGINLKAVRSYAQQMFLGLSLFRKCNILHADLKPDNVLVNETRNLLKICDLGSAADASDNEITPYLASRFYRAPEIILGIPYDFAIDMWSIGCTLFELYTGKILFTGRTNNQMLRSIMECRGKFSLKMLKKAEYAGVHFDDQLNFKSVEKDNVTGRDVTRLMGFTGKPTRDLKGRLLGTARGLSDVEMKDLNLFVDLLERCLSLNPEKRCSPGEALRHPFIAKGRV